MCGNRSLRAMCPTRPDVSAPKSLDLKHSDSLDTLDTLFNLEGKYREGRAVSGAVHPVQSVQCVRHAAHQTATFPGLIRANN